MLKARMLVKCSGCGQFFDSTFTAKDFEGLPREGLKSGTMHLCPYCGHLGRYFFRDYVEEKD